MDIVILISGYGSNLKAIIDHVAYKQLPINILAVISDNHLAYGLKIAQEHNITTYVIPYCKQTNAIDLLEVIKPLSAHWILLAGYMRIIPAEFIMHYQNKIINIHPSLLPKYPGLDTHSKVLANKDKEHGCTIHIVTDLLDAGPIMAQSKCSIEGNDTLHDIKNKVQKLEQKLYPEIIEKLLEISEKEFTR